MRIAAFAAIILIVLSGAYLVYLEYGRNSNQDPEPLQNVEPNTDITPTEQTDSANTPDTYELPLYQGEMAPPEMLNPQAFKDLEERFPNVTIIEDSSTVVEDTSTFPTQADFDSQSDSDLNDRAEVNPYAEKPWMKPIHEMSDEELLAEVARRKRILIEEFGNTPEVALVNKYTTVDILLGKTVYFEGNDGLEYIRALQVLWPDPVGAQIYEELEEMRKNGWHK